VPGPVEVEAEATPAPEAADAAELAARLLRLAAAGAAALAADDPGLDAERAVMAEYYAAEPSDRPYVPGDPDPLRDGLLAGARARGLSGPAECGRRKRSRFLASGET
jgi:hypothetical protein